MGDRVYDTKAWRDVRQFVLDRDSYRCRVTHGCERPATTADHIIPPREGGSWYDPDNLRATCGPCNSARANRRRGSDGWRRSRAEIVLVVGPPLAGKSTYVREHMHSGDLVVDYDNLATALGSDSRYQTQSWHPVVNAARNAVLDKIRAGEVEAERVWIVSTNPAAREIFPYHEVIELNPGQDVVRERAAGSDRTPQALAHQDTWFQPAIAEADVRPSREW